MFVSAGIESAVEQATKAAETGDVCIMCGAETVQQYLEAGLVDELWIHLVPVLLGDGIRLFETVNPAFIELEPTVVVATQAVTHLRFDVVG
ncbi:dihydrofolate reductase family protein [Halocatena halophila]|uniref:dihydrofolate reductase family protein n=1 Tax=Halocatena halophila TaxID=2814576 RepID=UPI002ED2ECC8